jgi:hypothetical protein
MATMKFWTTLATTLVLACVPLTALSANTSHHAVQFPANDAPYADARALLLKQGLVIARDPRSYPNARRRAAQRKRGIFVPGKLAHPDQRFREIDCRNDRESVYCFALFLETDERGWRNYIIVYIDPKNKTVIDARYPAPVEGLPSIPGPLASDVPQLKGSYLVARKTLRSLGFQPARNRQFEPGRFYVDHNYMHFIVMTETECSGTGQAYCLAFWISKDKRVLRITTIGEDRRIYFVEWSTWKDLQTSFGKLGGPQ